MRIEDLQAQLEAGVAALVDGNDWQRFLQVAARFHTYSPNNCVLILTQRPDATRVAGYRAWQRLGRQVHLGAHVRHGECGTVSVAAAGR